MTELTRPVAMPAAQALDLLNRGELTIEARVTSASNATLYCRVECEGIAAACVYKPVSGERPLWDFPDGTLAGREVAAYLVAGAAGWEQIPPTVLRTGPMGTGMVQLWIEQDDEFDIIAAINSGEEPQLRRMALLDAVLNNSDRKVSHLLPVPASDLHGSALHIFGIDHGVSFATENKLRTVLWQWAGDPVPDEGIEMLNRLAEQLDAELGEWLSELLTTREVRATRRRVQRLLARQTFPMPPTDWPAVPYPPY
ncbi:SCO1664 family protein [Jatrophihabitans lederbergiae]|uniref:SCO1664 family protein n=1 Tax=Jatrophihabitans lederbergiae TaxID=3075547 RepID=A0ABU2JCV9_9ACTN|nr:SCO1664 family protein [Jatrophihabitans sp. DSM 44399]MDT0262833.1 SCO1664 family protein [Jatrophihabitans sp. DSM 44399]